jgi:hypothetical protein
MIRWVSMPRLNWVIIQSDTALTARPISRISLMLIRPISWPTANMAMNEPMPRGMLTRPVKATG